MRTEYCGNVTKEHLGKDVSIRGWVHRRRDHGGVIFLDIRDDGFGKKIKDSELIGVPVSIVFGKNFTDHNKVEIIFRNGEKVASTLNEIEEII